MRLKRAAKETRFPIGTPLKSLGDEEEDNLGLLMAADDVADDDDIIAVHDTALGRGRALSIQVLWGGRSEFILVRVTSCDCDEDCSMQFWNFDLWAAFV